MITVWGRRNSVNVQKVMWTLGELNLDYERHDTGGSFGLGDDYLSSKNPNGVVPTIQDGDLTMYESNACVRYLARAYGLGGLCPDGRTAGICDQWMDWQATAFSPVFFLIFFNKIRLPADKSNAADIERGLLQTARCLEAVETKLANSEYLAGDVLTMADIPFAAMLFRYFTMDIERPEWPNLRRYYAAISSRSAYQKHVMIPFGRNSAEWAVEERNNAGIQ